MTESAPAHSEKLQLLTSAYQIHQLEKLPAFVSSLAYEVQTFGVSHAKIKSENSFCKPGICNLQSRRKAPPLNEQEGLLTPRKLTALQHWQAIHFPGVVVNFWLLLNLQRLHFCHHLRAPWQYFRQFFSWLAFSLGLLQQVPMTLKLHKLPLEKNFLGSVLLTEEYFELMVTVQSCKFYLC